MARRVSWTNNSSGHLGTYVYRAATLDPQNLPEPVATVGPVAQGETAEWIDTEELTAGDYDYAVRDYDASGEGGLSAVVAHNIPDPYASAQIGDEIGGGIYAGIDTIGGVDYHIVSGKLESEVFGLTWKFERTLTANTGDASDGLANTQAMQTAGIADHPAAQHCVNYNGGGFDDWHMPANTQIQLIYANLLSHPEFQGRDGDSMWSSTAKGGLNAYYIWGAGNLSDVSKTATSLVVRPIRRIPV